MYHEASSSALKEKLPALVASAGDEHFNKVIRFLASIPGAWEWSGESARIRAQEFVRNGPMEKLPKYIPYCLRSPHPRALALVRLESVDSEQTLQKLIRMGPDVVYADRAIDLLGKSSAFRVAEDRLHRLVIPLSPVLLPEHLQKISELFENNDQITWAAGTADLMLELFGKTSHIASNSEPFWRKVFDVLSTHAYYTDSSRGNELRSAINRKFKFVEEALEEPEPQELL
jgi:hypothetical protein